MPEPENPLLSYTGLPPFHQIETDHVVPAVRGILRQCEEAVARLEKNGGQTWVELMLPLELMDRQLKKVWGPVVHLTGVRNSPELRKAYEEVQGEVVAFYLRISQSRPLYDAMVALSQSGEFATMPTARKRILEQTKMDARLGGIELTGKARDRFNTICQELSRLSTRFSNNVLDATKHYQLMITDKEDVRDMPESFLSYAAQTASQKTGKEADAQAGPWCVTLDYPGFVPFMEHCRNRNLREQVYKAYVSRASGGDWDNGPLIEDILRLRQEKASLLGFPDYAELSLATKMADSRDRVHALLQELCDASADRAREEYTSLGKFANEKGFQGDLRHWDIHFWSERWREEKLGLSDEVLRPYFPLDTVLEGLFDLVRRIFAIEVRQVTGGAPTWHEDVRFYEINDQNGKHIASFFLDPFSRPETKQGGAWMDGCVNRGYEQGQMILPVAYLICNSTPPVGGRPALLTFREVETLFHEFGHGLQHMLTTVDDSGAAGISGVEWDAVELPSQFMENWCYHEDTLKSLTRHVDTGERLPDELFRKIIGGRTWRAASAMVRQLHFGMTDLALHTADSPSLEEVLRIDQEIAGRTLAIPPLPEDRFLCSFSHIFAGGYAAGYYSYKWAEVLSADAFSAFEDAGLNNGNAIQSTGQRFRDTVLAKGGSEHPGEIFRQFRGRDPEIGPLLRHSGLVS